jgi:hypothetical protein
VIVAARPLLNAAAGADSGWQLGQVLDRGNGPRAERPRQRQLQRLYETREPRLPIVVDCCSRVPPHESSSVVQFPGQMVFKLFIIVDRYHIWLS